MPIVNRSTILATILVTALLTGCNEAPEEKWNLNAGSVPIEGTPASPVVAAVVEWAYGGMIGSRLLVVDSEDQVHALPTALSDDCHPNYPWDTALSPDGKWIALTIFDQCGEPKGQELRIVNTATGEQTTIRREMEFGDLAWSPDSTRLVVRIGSDRMEVVDVKGAVLAKLPAGSQVEWAPGELIAVGTYAGFTEFVLFTPEGMESEVLEDVRTGTWITKDVFAGGRYRGEYPNTKRDLRFYRPDGSETKVWECPPAALSPNGETVAGVGSTEPEGVFRSTQVFLEVCDFDTGRRTRLSPSYAPVVIDDPHWLPDGRIVAIFLGTLQVIDPVTGEHEPLAKSASGTGLTDLSTIAY